MPLRVAVVTHNIVTVTSRMAWSSKTIAPFLVKRWVVEHRGNERRLLTRRIGILLCLACGLRSLAQLVDGIVRLALAVRRAEERVTVAHDPRSMDGRKLPVVCLLYNFVG